MRCALPNRRNLLTAAMAGAVLFWAAPGPAQGPTQSPAGTFGETIDVRVINVEVVATDEEGRRVTGLGPGDFRLEVDGESRSIDYFTEVHEGRAVAAGEGVRPAAGLAADQAVPTGYLIFIDDYLTLERDRNRVLAKIRSDLGRLSTTDRIAVVAFDGRSIDLLTGWTASPRDLDRAFAAARKRPTFGLQAQIRRKQILSGRGREGLGRSVYNRGQPDVQSWPGGSNRFGRPTPAQEEWAHELWSRLHAEVAAVSSALRSFGSAPGRKVAIVLAGDWPFDPVDNAVGPGTIPTDSLGVARGEDLYGALADTANLLGFTLYPVDVAGNVGASGGVISGEAGGSATAGGSLLPEQDTHTTLLHLASRTGGKAMVDDRRDTAFARTAEDTRTFYWLGFTAERTGDDQSRTIEVAALRPGLEIRTRQGYLDFSREAEVSAAVESLLLFEQGAGIAAEPLPVRPNGAERSGRKTLDFGLTLGIPVDRITMLPTGKSWKGELELRVATLDENGDRSEIPIVPIHLESPTEPKPGGLVRYDTTLTLRRVKQEVVVSVFDPPTGRLLASRMTLDPEALLKD